MKTILYTARLYAVALVSTIYHAVRIVWHTSVNTRWMERVCFDSPRQWCRSLLWAGGVEVQMEGLANLDPPRPAVLVANHESWYDVFALAGLLPVDYRFVGKKELIKVPFFGRAWVACGHIPIDRSDRKSAIESLRVAGARIREDRAVVVMFPEGTRSKDGHLLPFKKGAFVLALQMGVPVIPVGISGSRALMPKGAAIVRPGRMTVRIGHPIEVEGRTLDDRDALVEETRAAVEALRSVPAVGPGSDPES